MVSVLGRAMDGDVRPVLPAFRLHPREQRFAERLLTRHPRFWLFRTHQQRRAGDFAVLDMSSPDPRLRPLWVVDLKLGAPLKIGGGGAGNQLTNAASAAEQLRAAGLAVRRPTLATGDGMVLLAAIAKEP